MQWSELTVEQLAMLARLYNDYTLTTKERQATMRLKLDAMGIGVTITTAERNLRSYITYQKQHKELLGRSITIKESPKKQYIDYEVLETDNCLIISDIEIPDHNSDMLKLALLDAIENGVKDCIIAGDLIATDQATLNAWVTRWLTTDRTSFESDIFSTRHILKEYLRHFERVIIIEGNHDDRIARKTGGELHLGMLIHDLNVVYSRYEYMYIKTSRGYVKVVHPQNFSKNPVTLGQQLYNVERGAQYPAHEGQKCHFVVAHCHRAQRGFSEDGMFEIHSLGAMRDDLRTLYKMKSSNKHAQWDNSYMMILEGYFEPRLLRGTNWKKVLGDLYAVSPLATNGASDKTALDVIQSVV